MDKESTPREQETAASPNRWARDVISQVVFDEFQLQEANAFQPAALFKLAGLENGARLVWRVPLPMQLFLG